MLTRRKILLADIESTYGSDPGVSGSDAILVENLNWSNAGLKMVARPAVRPSLAALQQVYAGRLVTVSGTIEMKGSSAAGTPPEYDPILRAAGLAVTNVPSTSDTYAPASSGLESAYLRVYEDGKAINIGGCRGNCTFNFNAGERCTIDFEMTGHVGEQTDTALATPSFQTPSPPPFIGASFTIDSYAATLSALTFTLGNQIAMPASANGADGYDEITIVSRNITGSLAVLDELVATEDFIGNFTSGALMALATGTIGGTAGNRFALTAPAVYYTDATPEDREGVAGLALPIGFAESSGDDEISLAFT